MNHTKPDTLPPEFDFARFEQFCKRGFSRGVGKADGRVCIEAAISLCMGEGLSDKPSCVHPVIRAHAIRLNDACWSSPAARSAGLCDYGLAQLGTANLDGVEFAKRLALATIREILPIVLRRARLEERATACENAKTNREALTAARAAKNAAYAAYAPVAYAPACASVAAADAAVADAAYAAYAAAYAASASVAERNRILSLSAQIATRIINEMRSAQ